MSQDRRQVFITGGSGYLGRTLIQRLVVAGHSVRALVRSGSEHKLPVGCEPIVGNALDPDSYVSQISPSDTFVQLVGVAHPSPAKGKEFRSIDFVSASGAIHAASATGVKHFVYLSVAHPAPMMKEYIQVRSECEQMLADIGMNATILRPWYVLGPGHWWPYALMPFYKLCEIIPSTREGALRLGLVTHQQMVTALLQAVENPCAGRRIIEVPEIRAQRGV